MRPRVSATVTSFLSIDSSQSSGRRVGRRRPSCMRGFDTERSRNLDLEVRVLAVVRSAASPVGARSSLPDGLFIDALEALLADDYTVASSEVLGGVARFFFSGALRRAHLLATLAIASAMSSRC
jgi:hypothetical protein